MKAYATFRRHALGEVIARPNDDRGDLRKLVRLIACDNESPTLPLHRAQDLDANERVDPVQIFVEQKNCIVLA